MSTAKRTILIAGMGTSRQLAKIGVDSVGTFRAIIHSSQNRECEDRKHELEAKREAERKAKRTAKPCSQFINHGHAK